MAYSLTYSYDSTDKAYSVERGTNITTSDKVVIPATYNDGTNGEHPVTSISSEAFGGCSNLVSITIPNSVTIIGEWAFVGCSSLTSITIPNGVTRIGPHTFNDCSSLTSITIPNSVTSIGDWAFYGCTKLPSVTIPNSVTSIESDVFHDCPNLTQLILLPSTPPTLSSGAIPSTIQSIYVQQSSKAAYQAAANWATFASKIISNNLYLSFAQFNQKNKEYIYNSDSLLANDIAVEATSRKTEINSLVGSGIQGTGNPPLQEYNKDKGTIEDRFKIAEQTTNKFNSSYRNDFSPDDPHSNSIKIPINSTDINTLFFVMIAIYDRSNDKWLNCCMTIGEGKPATGYFIIKETFSNTSVKTVSCTYSSNNEYVLTGPSDKVSGSFKYNLIRAAVLRIA